MKPYDGNTYVASFICERPFADVMQSFTALADAIGWGKILSACLCVCTTDNVHTPVLRVC